MSNYNKHINSFSAQTEYNLYIFTEDCQVPNVAYIEENETVKMLKVKPKEITGEVGGIYYSDGTITGPNDAVDTSKTPIGVIVQAPTTENMLKTTIMSLYDIKSDGTNSPNNNNTCKYAISNTAAATTDNPEIPNDDDGNKDISVYSGKAFTKVLVDKYGSDAQAAYACSIYSTEGTEAGDWYLPSASELKQLCANNYTVVDNTLTKLKNISKGYILYTTLGLISSSEYNNERTVRVQVINGEIANSLKYAGSPIRAFCTFDPFKNL